MKTRFILIFFAAVLLAAGFFLWRNHVAESKKAEAGARREAIVSALKAKQKEPTHTAAAARKFSKAKVAVVMDDFGYNMNDLETLFAIRQPITLSILPNLPYSREIADIALSRGYEVILHLPLEARGEGVREEFDTIRSGMARDEIIGLLAKGLDSVPGAKGVSNHMGSKMTEEAAVMSVIFKYLKKRGLYFFDSLTSNRSVCKKTAADESVRCARRDIFLDISSDPVYIEKQLSKLKAAAFRRGRAIAVCHDRRNTIMALSKLMPEMAREGIVFVPLSEMVD